MRRFLHLLALVSVSTLAFAQSPATPPETPTQTSVATAVPLNPALPTIFIVGDSTARNQADLGWGDHFAHFFDITRVNIANRAIAGRSYRSYLDEGHWDKTLSEIKSGDYVLLQMGHNDGGDLGGAKPRGDLKGLGEETQDVPQTSGPYAGKVETIHTYGWYARKYIADIRAKGATPILLSLTIRNIWKPDVSGTPRIERDMGYDALIKQLASDQHLAFVDMATIEADHLEALGPEKTAALFPIDHTHTSGEGAERNAESVVIALRNAKSPLVAYLKQQ